MTTKLTFEGTIAGCKPVLAKVNQYGEGTKGRVEVTLVVDQPFQERKPAPPYRYRDASGLGFASRDRIEERLVADESNTPEQRERELAEYDREFAEYTQLMTAWETKQAGFQEQLRSYASLVGIAAVFGNQKLVVTLTPANQDVLPGFELDLLGPAPSATEDMFE